MRWDVHCAVKSRGLSGVRMLYSHAMHSYANCTVHKTLPYLGSFSAFISNWLTPTVNGGWSSLVLLELLLTNVDHPSISENTKRYIHLYKSRQEKTIPMQDLNILHFPRLLNLEITKWNRGTFSFQLIITQWFGHPLLWAGATRLCRRFPSRIEGFYVLRSDLTSWAFAFSLMWLVYPYGTIIPEMVVPFVGLLG